MRLTVILLLLVSWGASPAILDLPIDATGTRELWFNSSYSTKQFDIFDYADKASKTTHFDYESAFQLGFNYDLDRQWGNYNLVSRGVVFRRHVSADRDVEPTDIDINHNGLSLQIQLMNTEQSQGFEIGFHYSRYPTTKFDKYQIGSIVFGEDIVLLDPETMKPLPLIEVKSKEFGLSLHYLTKMSQQYPLYLSAGYRVAQISPSVDSRLFHVTDQGFLDMEVKGKKVRKHIETIKSKAPQSDKWQEHIFDIKLIHDWTLNERWQNTTTIGGYFVTETNYDQGYDECCNFTLDTRLMYQITSNVSLFGRWHLASNYTLGIYPGTYNQQTISFFGHPYSHISLGLALAL